jgi:hypothetical protein
MGADAADEKLVADLKALAAAQNLRDRALEVYREHLREGAGDGLGGWSAEEIEVHFHHCSLAFDHGVLSYPFVDTRLGLYVRDDTGLFFDGLRPIRYFRLITHLDGTVDDTYFVIETNKPAVG